LLIATASEPKNLGFTACSGTQFPRFENLQIQAALKPKDYQLMLAKSSSRFRKKF
jgi:hypothetical protein